MTPGLAGRTALVTGGTDGIGKEIARRLATNGARVIIVGRDPQKGGRTESATIRFVQADLSLLREVGRLADHIVKRCPRLHYLVHCAGVVRGQYLPTPDGIESNFAIGYLSRFVLTARLLDLLRESGRHGAASRILVISGAARNGRIHYDDVNLSRNFGVLRAVSQLCEANDVFVLEQARREAGPVRIMTLKVGVVRTNIRHEFPVWMKLVVPLLDPFLAQTPQNVAEKALRLLASPEFEATTGALFHFQYIRRFRQIAPGPRTSDAAEGLRLWDLSERLAAKALRA